MENKMENAVENKRVSAEQIAEIMNERFPKTIVEDWFGVEVEITPVIGLADAVFLSDKVVDVCFMDDGTYAPEMADYVMRIGLVTLWANVDLPEGTDDKYYLLYRSGIADFIYEHINQEQYHEILEAANKKVELRNQKEVYGMERELAKFAEQVDEIGQKLDEMFSGVSADDVAKLVGAMAEHGEIDEEKIAKALRENAG